MSGDDHEDRLSLSCSSSCYSSEDDYDADSEKECLYCGKPVLSRWGLTQHLQTNCPAYEFFIQSKEIAAKEKLQKKREKRRKSGRKRPIVETLNMKETTEEMNAQAHKAPARQVNAQLHYQPSLMELSQQNPPPENNDDGINGNLDPDDEMIDLDNYNEVIYDQLSSEDDSSLLSQYSTFSMENHIQRFEVGANDDEYHVDSDDSDDPGLLSLLDDNSDISLGDEDDRSNKSRTSANCAVNCKMKEFESYIQQFRPTHAIDPDPDDQFNPNNFDESKAPIYLPRTCSNHHLDDGEDLSMLDCAQLDLLRILRKAGTPLGLYDKIMNWIKVYTEKKKTVWSDQPIMSRKLFIKKLSRHFNTQKRKPTIKEVESPVDGRRISVPVFSFVDEFMSILNNKSLMKDENLVQGYDISTGRPKNGNDVWKKNTIKEGSLNWIPTPNDPDKEISHLCHGTKFQQARDRYCTKPYHMPMPLVFFYDESHPDNHGGMTNAPMLFTLGYFLNYVKARIDGWRTKAVVPHLGLGDGKSTSKTADEKAQDHHLVLKAVFADLEDIMKRGGLWTTFRGKKVLIKFWIQLIIGDTKGHNELCGHYTKSSSCRNPMRRCQCKKCDLSTIPMRCKPILQKHIDECNGDVTELNKISQRPIENAFDQLALADNVVGVRLVTPFENLHVFDIGILQYLVVVIVDMMTAYKKTKTGKNGKSQKKQRMTGSSKRDRERLDMLVRQISTYLGRQSERDFPRRTHRAHFADASRLTGTERRGAVLCLAIVLHTDYGKQLFKPYLRKAKITVNHCQNAIVNILCYGKWLLQPNEAGEVISVRESVNRVFDQLFRAFPREDGDGWNIPKIHAAMMMWRQVFEDGNGDGINSCHGERFHKDVTNGAAKLTRKQSESMVKEMSDRLWEYITMDEATLRLASKLLISNEYTSYSANGIDANEDIPTTTTRKERDYISPENKCNTPKCEALVSGEYSFTMSKMKSNSPTVETKWVEKHKHSSGKPGASNVLQYTIKKHAEKHGWNKDELKMKGFTTMKKIDSTTGKEVLYRCDPCFMGRKWSDWALFSFKTDNRNNNLQVEVDPSTHVCFGQIVGFVRFVSPGFPTPTLAEKCASCNCSVPPDAVDERTYIVARCCTKYISKFANYGRELVTQFSLVEGVRSVWMFRVESLIGPLAVVPNIHTELNFGIAKFLAIKPYRQWGDIFASRNNIKNVSLPENEEEESDSESNMGLLEDDQMEEDSSFVRTSDSSENESGGTDVEEEQHKNVGETFIAAATASKRCKAREVPNVASLLGKTIELYCEASVRVKRHKRKATAEAQLLWWPGKVTLAVEARNGIKMDITWQGNEKVSGHQKQKTTKGMMFHLSKYKKSDVLGAWRIRED